jgi:hypothetical protein
MRTEDRHSGLAVRDKHHRRQRENAEACWQREVLVDVHPHESDTRAMSIGDCAEMGLDRIAWPAPGSPEVNDDGNRRRQYDVCERFVSDVFHGVQPRADPLTGGP